MTEEEQSPVLPSNSTRGEAEVQVTPAGEPDRIRLRRPVEIRNVALTVIATGGGILLLQYAAPVLIPVAVAVLMSYVLGPAVDSMHRHRIPRVLGSFIVIVFVCAGIAFGVYSLAGQAMAVVEKVPAAAKRVADRMDRQGRKPNGTLEKVQDAAKQVEQAAEQASDPAPVAKDVTRVQIVEPAFAARDYLWAGGMNLVGLAGQFGVVLFLLFFMLVTGDLFKRKLVRIAGPTLTKKKISVQIMDDINKQISTFLRVQVFTSVLVGAATAAALWWFTVEQYLVWGLLAGIFNSIPYLGPIIVSGGLGIVAFMQFDDVVRAASVSGTALAITSLEGWLLTPALMSRAAQMNPVAIFVGLLFWSWVWGVAGTILAVPMMMMVKAIADRIEDLQPIGELLGE